jgi:hypothetical protein
MFVYSYTLSGGCHHYQWQGCKFWPTWLCSALRVFEQVGIFIMPHLLQHGASVYTVSTTRSAPQWDWNSQKDHQIIAPDALTTAPHWWLDWKCTLFMCLSQSQKMVPWRPNISYTVKKDRKKKKNKRQNNWKSHSWILRHIA